MSLQYAAVGKIQFYGNTTRQKMAYAGHMLRGSGGINAAIMLESKINGGRT